jgi:seryl-tRNA synthetase
MLDKNFVRNNLELVTERLSARGGDYQLADLIAGDAELKRLNLRAEELRRARNEASEQIGRLKREGHDTAAQQARVKEIAAEIKHLEERGRALEEDSRLLLCTIPNLPHASVPVASGEAGNVEVRRWGAPPQFDFEPLDHVDIGSKLGILDMERASKIAGARFALLEGSGALMERALINFMMDVHAR